MNTADTYVKLGPLLLMLTLLALCVPQQASAANPSAQAVAIFSQGAVLAISQCGVTTTSITESACVASGASGIANGVGTCFTGNNAQACAGQAVQSTVALVQRCVSGITTEESACIENRLRTMSQTFIAQSFPNQTGGQTSNQGTTGQTNPDLGNVYPQNESPLADFIPIVPIPNITDKENLSFADYVNQLFLLSISAGAMLAVLMLIYGGFEYMTSDVIATKGKGIEKIRGALTGLVLLLASYLVLYIINPCILEITVLSGGTSECSPTEPQPEEEEATTPPAGNARGIAQWPAGSRVGLAGSITDCTTPVQPYCTVWGEFSPKNSSPRTGSCPPEGNPTHNVGIDVCATPAPLNVGSPP